MRNILHCLYYRQMSLPVRIQSHSKSLLFTLLLIFLVTDSHLVSVPTVLGSIAGISLTVMLKRQKILFLATLLSPVISFFFMPFYHPSLKYWCLLKFQPTHLSGSVLRWIFNQLNSDAGNLNWWALLVFQCLQCSDSRLPCDSGSGGEGFGPTNCCFYAGTTVLDTHSSSLHLCFTSKCPTCLKWTGWFQFSSFLEGGPTLGGVIFQWQQCHQGIRSEPVSFPFSHFSGCSSMWH